MEVLDTLFHVRCRSLPNSERCAAHGPRQHCILHKHFLYLITPTLRNVTHLTSRKQSRSAFNSCVDKMTDECPPGVCRLLCCLQAIPVSCKLQKKKWVQIQGLWAADGRYARYMHQRFFPPLPQDMAGSNKCTGRLTSRELAQAWQLRS